MFAWVVLFAVQALGTVLSVLAFPWLLYRLLRHPEEMRERLGWIVRPEASRLPRPSRPLWIHAASLGELEAIRGLIGDAEHAFSDPLHLTVLSVSGRPRAAAAFGPLGVTICFAPRDHWLALWAFLARRRPRGGGIAETELWPGMLASCRLARIPVAVVSGRLSARRWQGTRRLAWFYRPWLRTLAGCAVQTAGDADRFRALGAIAPVVTGNLKYRAQTVPPASPPFPGAPSSDRAGGDAFLLFVAGSLRLGEEAVLEAARVPDLRCVIAPRHLREREHWLAACAARGIEVVSRRESELEVPRREALRSGLPPRLTERAHALRAALRGCLERASGPPALLLLDTHGELASWYAAADAAFVGGTLVPLGGHNLFEPAREGIPVAFGPETGNVRDVAEPLMRESGGVEVRTIAALHAWLGVLRDDAVERARRGAAAHRVALELAGAGTRTWEFLRRLPWCEVRRKNEQAGSDPTGRWA